MQDIWAEADALLATPPPRQATAAGDIALPSVWDEVDSVLSAPPPPKVAPAALLTPGDAERGVSPRPAPIAAEGITDPASVRVTEPPPARGAYFNPKTGTRPAAIPFGDSPLDALAAGVEQAGRGVLGLAKAAATPPAKPSGRGYLNPKTGVRADVGDVLEPQTLDAASDVAEGIFKAATPLMIGGAVAQPMETAVALAQAAMADKFGAKAAQLLGASESGQRLVGNVAALLSGSVSAAEIVDKVRADVRSVADQARAFDAAHPDLAPGASEAPREPTPAGRGATPAAGGRLLEEPAALAPDTLAEIDRLLEEKPVAESAPPAPQELVERSSAAAPPAVAGPGPAVPEESTAVDLAPDTVAEIDRLLSTRPAQTPAADELPHEFSSTQVQLPPATATALQRMGAQIPDHELAADGREGDAHVTVKFGLHGNDAAAVQRVLEGEPPIQVRLGKTSFFPNGKSNAGDVVKVDVDSADLHRLNAKIAAALPTTDTHPTYRPHATIAYVKPGLGEKYAGDASVEGHTATIDRVVFSGRDGKKTEIVLRGDPGRRIETSDGRSAETPVGPLASDRVEERAVADAGGAQPSVRGEAGRRPLERRPSAADAARAAEADTLDALIGHAKAHGFAGDETHLKGELASRLALIKDLDAEYATSGRHPETLLRDIARAGGLSVNAETGLKGELRWLKEFQDNVGGTATKPRTQFGQVRGVQGVFNERGRSVDDLLGILQQDPRYAHLDTVDTLLEEIRAAAMADDEGTAVQRLREGLGDRWWERIGRPGDTLDTGEIQARLPGAEGARQVGQADTSFRAPVQATGDDFARSFLGENDLPIDVDQDLFNDEPGSMGMPRRPFAGAWERTPRAPGEKPRPPVPARPPATTPSLRFDEKTQAMPRRPPPPVSPRPSATRGFFGKQELPANRPTTLPARRFGRKIRPLPVAEMVHKMTDLFGGVPVSVGRLYKGYLGVYQSDTESIRVQVADDLHVIAHEMGHHLDMAIMEGSKVFNRGVIAQELKRVGAATSLPSYTAAQQRREGTAEFFRRWLTDPTGLTTEAPRFSTAFEQYLDRHPKIAKGLREIRNDVQRYVALPADEQARLHIDFEGGGNAILQKAQELGKAAKTPEGRRGVIAYLSSHWMDDLAALRVAEESLADGRPIDIAESAYVQARLARGAAAKAEGFLSFGVRDRDGTFIGRSFDDALGPVLDRLEDFALYAAARRAKTMHARGKESGFTASQVTATIDKYQSPVFDQALEGLREFHRAKLDYMVRGGAISDDQRTKMLKVEPDYIPYQRIHDTASSILSGKKIANRGSPVKKLKGSGRRIANPLETVIRNTHTEVSMVESNRAMGQFVRLAIAAQGHGKWLEEIPEPQVATRFKLSELGDQIRAALEENGVDIPQIPDMDTMLDEFATVFTPQQFARGNDRIVTWLDRGKRRWFEVHDAALYDALTAIGPRGTEQVVKWFLKPAKLLQRTAVSTVGFLIRNPIKDQFAATVQSRAGYRPGIDFLRGLFAYLGKNEQYQLYVNSLADQATMVSDNRDILRRRLRELGHTKLRTFLNHTVLGPFDGLNALSHAGESATRIGEFMRTIDKAGAATETSLTQAALNARDVTQDFQRAGRQVRAWNQFTAFFSARVGGYGRMWEAFHEDPTTFTWKALAAVTLPSILLWLLNHDDDEYNELPAWERNYYWHVPLTVAGKRLGFIRFPKPFELGQLFGTSTELALEYLTKSDPQVANRLMSKQDAAQMVEQVFPTTILPLAEVFANYDFFRGRTIVNPWQEDLAAPLQYNRWTSETAKKLGDIFDLSPAKIDTLIYGYTAGVGQGAMDAVDLAVGSHKPAGGPGRWPGVGAIFRPLASSDAETFTEFYNARDALAGLKSSVKQYRELGKADQAQALLEKNRKLAPFEARVPAADRQLKDFRDAVNQVFANTTMTPEQKRTALDGLYLQMLNIARQGLGKASLSRKPRPPVPALR